MATECQRQLEELMEHLEADAKHPPPYPNLTEYSELITLYSRQLEIRKEDFTPAEYREIVDMLTALAVSAPPSPSSSSPLSIVSSTHPQPHPLHPPIIPYPHPSPLQLQTCDTLLTE